MAEFVIYCEKRKPAPWDQKITAGHLTASSQKAAEAAFKSGFEFKQWRFLACEPQEDFLLAMAKNPHLSEGDFVLMRYQVITGVKGEWSDKKAKPAPALPVEVWNEKPVDTELAWQTTKVLCSGGHF